MLSASLLMIFAQKDPTSICEILQTCLKKKAPLRHSTLLTEELVKVHVQASQQRATKNAHKQTERH